MEHHDDSTSSRRRVSAMNLMVGSDESLRSVTTDTKMCFSCFLLQREDKDSFSSHCTLACQLPHHNHTSGLSLSHIPVQVFKVSYEVHNFCCAELWELGLSLHREHNQRTAVLIKHTCSGKETHLSVHFFQPLQLWSAQQKGSENHQHLPLYYTTGNRKFKFPWNLEKPRT